MTKKLRNPNYIYLLIILVGTSIITRLICRILVGLFAKGDLGTLFLDQWNLVDSLDWIVLQGFEDYEKKTVW